MAAAGVDAGSGRSRPGRGAEEAEFAAARGGGRGGRRPDPAAGEPTQAGPPPRPAPASTEPDLVAPPPRARPAAPAQPVVARRQPDPRDALVEEVADALATGEPAAVERLATRGGRDPFAVAAALERGQDRAWERATTDAGVAAAERADEAAEGVRLGRGPVAYALALDATLREAGALAPGEGIATLEEARARVASVPDEIAYAVRDALQRAEAASGVESAALGIVQGPPPPARGGLLQRAAEAAAGAASDALGAVADAADLLRPSQWTLGWNLPSKGPITGSVSLSMPWTDAGPTRLGDFTERDGTPTTTIQTNIRLHRPIRGEGDDATLAPLDQRFAAGAGAYEIESANLGAVLRGQAPLVGENGLVVQVERGLSASQGATIPGLPLPGSRFGAGTAMATVREGVDHAADQRVYNVTISANVGLDSLACGALIGASGVAAVVPGGQLAALGLLRAAHAVDRAATAARATFGMATIGLSWKVEARFDDVTHPDGPGFAGIYYRGRRVDLASEVVEAEIANPFLPGRDPIESLFARGAVAAADRLLVGAGLPTIERTAAALPPGVRAQLPGLVEDVEAAVRAGSAAAALQPDAVMPLPGQPSMRDVAFVATLGEELGPRLRARAIVAGALLLTSEEARAAMTAVASGLVEARDRLGDLVPDFPRPADDATPPAERPLFP